MAAEAAGDEAVAESKAKLSFLDLPAETQQEIISHCQQSDLICVALVSKHFHELASAQLYRNFHIVFPDDDDLNFDSPIDGLAGGLDTFTTSEYNYAKHLKDLSMDTLSAGAKGELSYQSYLYSASCGKFLNTLLYLTLKNAKSLEAFRWNIRVELSRPVYRELHRITSLKRLHIRLQSGESYYTPPPPLPISVDTHASGLTGHWPEVPPLSPTPLTMVTFPPSNTSLFGNGGAPPPPPLVPSSKSLPKSKTTKRGSPTGEPSTLSGFKNLKTLSVLDIDDLDIVTELRTCVKNCSSTLTELHLSLSDTLALQARKPPPDSDPEDSDLEDDFQVGVSTHNAHSASEPARMFRAQEERKVQEAMLGRIFDVEHLLAKKSPKDSKAGTCTCNGKGKGKEEVMDSDPREEFITSIRSVSSQLLSLINGSSDFPSTHQDILDTIEKASRKYVESGDLPGHRTEQKNSKDSKNSTKSQSSAQAESSTAASETPNKISEPATSLAHDADKQTSQSTDAAAKTDGTTSTSEVIDSALQDKGNGKGKGKGIAASDPSPDDIDMEHIEQADNFDDFDDQKPESTPEETSSTKPWAVEPSDLLTAETGSASSVPQTDAQKLGLTNKRRLTLQATNRKYQDRSDSISHKLKNMRLTILNPGLAEKGEAEILRYQTLIRGNQAMIEMLKAEEQDLQAQIGLKKTQTSMTDYLRDTRGMSLESLSLHLIPVKPSVLSKAVDLHTLRQLTLLNVGNQAPIWAMLAKENNTQPLQLRSIFTDNVSNAFLACVSQLEELHELFMLERSAKYKPESFAPRSTITIDQIRRLALAKHMPTLRRLMIKDESTSHQWDANEKTMIHICTRGQNLEELAVSMNIGSVHAFLQYLSHLTKLRALHILHFKNNDTCIWVMREILRFIVDNLSHHPELKLEWIGMEDDRVDRVVRPSELNDDCSSEKEKKQKGKGKSPASGTTTEWSASLPLLPSLQADSESDSDDESYGHGNKLRFKTSGPMQFYDVWAGIKIFEKEIRSGRL